MKNPILLHLPLFLPKTGIMVTIGKANSNDTALRKMADEGATVFRLNAGQFKDQQDGTYYVECEDTSKPVDEVIHSIRRLETDLRRPLLTYLDLAGPKLRVEEVRGGNDHPEFGDPVRVYLDPVPPDKRAASKQSVCVIYVRDAQHQRFSKNRISFRDGRLVVDIERKEKDKEGYYYCEGTVATVPFDFKWLVRDGRRGANVGCNPVGYHFPEIITPYDHRVIEWAVDVGIDVYSQSFVCHPIDAFRLRCALAQKFKKNGHDPKLALEQTIIGKVETAPAVDVESAHRYAKYITERSEHDVTHWFAWYKLPEVIELGDVAEFKDLKERFKYLSESYLKDPIVALAEAFDGLMVARGDLAVEIGKVNVPNLQRTIANQCRIRSKAVIIATEVLPSMQGGLPSTRAEIGDINTAVFQEADIIMLGGEVASSAEGFTPAQVVRELREAIDAAEDARRTKDEERNFEERQIEMGDVLTKNGLGKDKHDQKNRADIEEKLSMGARACNAARTKKSPAIFASVTTGTTARYIADFSPRQPIIAITSRPSVARFLLLYQGVYPVTIQRDFDHTVESLVDILLDCHGNFYRDKTWPSESVVCPALLRIESAERASSSRNKGETKSLRPNTLLEITLPEHPDEVEETEWKYLLSKQNHSRLRTILLSRYQSAREVTQQNAYFTDSDRRLSQKRISLRLRLRVSPEAKAEQKEKVLLTWKGPDQGGPSGLGNSGFAMRPEAEYDVTQAYQAWRKERPIETPFHSFSIRDLPEFWRIIWERSEAYGVEPPQDAEALGDFKPIGYLQTARLFAVTKSGVSLELDRWQATSPNEIPSGFPTDFFEERYELEVEDRPENGEKVDEVIHDLFAGLDIPIIQGESPKVLFALLRSGAIAPGEASDEIRKINESDYQIKNKPSHLDGCDACKVFTKNVI
jgi:pyruvate kinase